MFCGLGDEGRSLLAIFLLLIPTALYIMGLLEGRKGFYVFLSGIFFHILSIIIRGIEIGRIPLSEKHDTISFMALVMAFTYLYFYKRKGMTNLGIVALPLISVFLFISHTYQPINTISPFLKSIWFYLHVLFYFVSYGLFGISACIGIIYMIKGKSEYESLQYKGIINGWIILSISLVIGSVWFFLAYGTYWLWTSRELWSMLLWFYYSLYLHARLINGLKGWPAAVIGCLGFLVALFTYFGIGTIIPSPPTQF